jgi:aminoglycoside phosphotransferase (APT) family kinase protein
VLIHLDLHPLNVILGDDGPVVIDWTNARRGNGDADAALTWLLMMTGEIDEGRLQQLLATLGRRAFARFFLARFVRKGVMAQLDVAAAYKLRDPNLREVERTAIRRIIAETRR